jgi:uncharacterized membrane protein
VPGERDAFLYAADRGPPMRHDARVKLGRRPRTRDRVERGLADAHRSPAPLAAFFVFAGVMHFLRPSFYLRIMPPSLPRPRQLVYASGLAEIAGGVGVMVPVLRPAARWGLIALLVAVFPANVYPAVRPEAVGLDSTAGRTLLWLRLPLQAAFVAWVVSATRER